MVLGENHAVSRDHHGKDHGCFCHGWRFLVQRRGHVVRDEGGFHLCYHGQAFLGVRVRADRGQEGQI